MGVLSTITVSRLGSTRVVMAQMTSFQSRTSTSSSTTTMNFGIHELAQEAPDAEHHPFGVAGVLLLHAHHRHRGSCTPSGGR